jgi:hypothetical protein
MLLGGVDHGIADRRTADEGGKYPRCCRLLACFMIVDRNGRYLAKTVHDHEVTRTGEAGLASFLEP